MALFKIRQRSVGMLTALTVVLAPVLSWSQTAKKPATKPAAQVHKANPPKVAKTSPAPQPTINNKSQELSNRLPVEFVKLMMEKNLWKDSYEEPSSEDSQDIHQFLNGLQRGGSFESLAEDTVKKYRNYQIKIHFFRYLATQPAVTLQRFGISSKRLQDFESQLLTKYIEMAVTLIRLSDLSEYTPITSELQRRISQNQIRVADLSPANRQSWANESSDNHHVYETPSFLQEENGKFLINGAYSETKKTLAIDLSRPINENLITLGHEIVHAADPELYQARENLKRSFDQVAILFAKRVSTQNANSLLQALLSDVFYEMGRPDLKRSVDQFRDRLLQRLDQNLDKDLAADLRKHPALIQLMKSLIQVTVENEYKAYTFSMALYQTLKGRYQLIPPSIERKAFMEKQFHHAHSLPVTLSLSMNPFSNNAALSRLQGEIQPDQFPMIQKLKSVLEIHYLEQSKQMVESIPAKYERMFKILNEAQRENDANEGLEEWMKPGKFDSPSNPYQIVAVKISTAQVIRFKQYLDKFRSGLEAMQETLMGLNAGLMDLHDLTLGEMKLLGIHAENAELSKVLPPSVEERLKKNKVCERPPHYIFDKDLYQHPVEFQAYFQELKWTPESLVVGQNGNVSLPSIPQSELMKNLYRLRLLKAVYWLREDFPQGKDNIVSIKAFQARLFEGQYDKNEISPARARELIAELRTYIEAAAGTSNELKNAETYMSTAARIYAMVYESKWQPLAEEFYNRIQAARKLFENMGFESKDTFDQIEARMRKDIHLFREQVRNEFRACAQTDRLSFRGDRTCFDLGPYKFPLTAICLNRQLYIFRQPGDYNSSATTLTPNGVPTSRIFLDPKPIALDPFESFR